MKKYILLMAWVCLLCTACHKKSCFLEQPLYPPCGCIFQKGDPITRCCIDNRTPGDVCIYHGGQKYEIAFGETLDVNYTEWNLQPYKEGEKWEYITDSALIVYNDSVSFWYYHTIDSAWCRAAELSHSSPELTIDSRNQYIPVHHNILDGLSWSPILDYDEKEGCRYARRFVLSNDDYRAALHAQEGYYKK